MVDTETVKRLAGSLSETKVKDLIKGWSMYLESAAVFGYPSVQTEDTLGAQSKLLILEEVKKYQENGGK